MSCTDRGGEQTAALAVASAGNKDLNSFGCTFEKEYLVFDDDPVYLPIDPFSFQ